MKIVAISMAALIMPGAVALGQSSHKAEITQIRGKAMGFSAVSPAVQKEAEAKYGKKPAPDPRAKGPNAHVGKHGFAYVSVEAETKKKK